MVESPSEPASPIDFEPDPQHLQHDPYPLYRELRDRAPVHWAPQAQAYCISRYDDVQHVLKHPEIFSSEAMRTVLMERSLGGLTPRYVFALLRFLWKARLNPFRVSTEGNLVSFDPPRHDALRAVVNRGFSPRRIAAWEPRIRAIANEQLAAIDRGDHFDVVDELAIPLPVRVIAEFLGAEPEMRQDFKRWSDSVVAVASGAHDVDPVRDGHIDRFTELYGYLRGLIRERRAELRDDLISVLVDPTLDPPLSDVEVVQFVVLLLVAGNETTTNLIGNAVNALLDRPEWLERMVANPSLAPDVIEETLRYDPPVQLVFRTATRDVEIAGTRISKGAILVPLLGSANRDERRFENPDVFDPKRDAKGHLGFGFGIHFCLGASLARLEARVALEGLVPELPNWKRNGERKPLESFLVRGSRHLDLIRVG